MSRNSRIIFLTFLGALALTLPTVGLRDITTSHEGRVAQTARVMAASGWPWSATPSSIPAVGWVIEDGVKRLEPNPTLPPLQVNPWIVPVINGQARLQKPPLPYWVTATMFKLLGVNEWAARIVPAILGALLTLIVADLARMLVHRRMAIWAAGFWISSYFIFDEFRKCMADPYLAFFVIASVWAWARSFGECGAVISERKTRFVILFYVFLGFGFLAKGPAVFAIALPGAAACSWVAKQRPRASLAVHLAGLALMLLIALPWYAVVMKQVPNARDLWKYEAIGGFGEKNEKPEPFWFYLPQLLLIALPWTPLWAIGLAVAGRNFRRRGAALIWQVTAVLIFSVITQKKNAYLLPATAAQVLLATQGLRSLLAAARRHGVRHLHRPVAIVITILAVAIAAGFPIYSEISENGRSFRPVGEEMTQLLGTRGGAVEIAEAALPPDAAFYLPLPSPVVKHSDLQWVVVDDRRNNVASTSRLFQSLYPDRTVQSVERLGLKSSPETFRWKVFEVRLAP